MRRKCTDPHRNRDSALLAGYVPCRLWAPRSSFGVPESGVCLGVTCLWCLLVCIGVLPCTFLVRTSWWLIICQFMPRLQRRHAQNAQHGKDSHTYPAPNEAQSRPRFQPTNTACIDSNTEVDCSLALPTNTPLLCSSVHTYTCSRAARRHTHTQRESRRAFDAYIRLQRCCVIRFAYPAAGHTCVCG